MDCLKERPQHALSPQSHTNMNVDVEHYFDERSPVRAELDTQTDQCQPGFVVGYLSAVILNCC
jgi:hypothetical protein